MFPNMGGCRIWISFLVSYGFLEWGIYLQTHCFDFNTSYPNVSLSVKWGFTPFQLRK